MMQLLRLWLHLAGASLALPEYGTCFVQTEEQSACWVPDWSWAMLTMCSCVGPCLQLSMSPVLRGTGVHTSSSLTMVLLRGAAQAKAHSVTAKTMQMGDVQSCPWREKVECHPLSSCPGGNKRLEICHLPWSHAVQQGQGDSTAVSGFSHVGQELLKELTWENLPASQGTSSVWRRSLPDNGPCDSREWSWR